MPTLQQAAGWGFAELWQMAKDYLAANIGEPLAFGLRAAGYLLVAGVLGLLAGANNWRRCIDAVAVLGFAAMSLAAGIDLVRAAGDTAQDCQNYLIAFVPVYSGIAAAGGQTAGALVYSGMFFAMAQFLAAVIGKLLLPVLEIYFCFAACACVWGSRAVEEAAALFSKCLHWLLKVCGAVFSFVLGLQSVLAGTADSAALRTGKSVLQGAVPVVGDAAAAALTGNSPKGAWRIWRRDRRNHASPNSAQTESACAGALGVQLAGPAYYFGEYYAKPTIGDPLRPIEPEDIRRANRMMYAESVLALAVGLAVRAIL